MSTILCLFIPMWMDCDHETQPRRSSYQSPPPYERPADPVPEPGSALLLTVGGLVVAAYLRREP